MDYFYWDILVTGKLSISQINRGITFKHEAETGLQFFVSPSQV